MVTATTTIKPVITAAAFNDEFTTTASEFVVVTATDEVLETGGVGISFAWVPRFSPAPVPMLVSVTVTPERGLGSVAAVVLPLLEPA